MYHSGEKCLHVGFCRQLLTSNEVLRKVCEWSCFGRHNLDHNHPHQLKLNSSDYVSPRGTALSQTLTSPSTALCWLAMLGADNSFLCYKGKTSCRVIPSSPPRRLPSWLPKPSAILRPLQLPKVSLPPHWPKPILVSKRVLKWRRKQEGCSRATNTVRKRKLLLRLLSPNQTKRGGIDHALPRGCNGRSG